MKLGYRERVALLVVLVILVFGVGIFAFIKPKIEKYNKNRDALKVLQDDWDNQCLQFDRIPGRQENIKKHYQEGLDISKNFTDEMNSVELDEFLREKFMNTDKFKEDKVKLISNFSVSDETTTSMNYYYVTPNIVTYPLVEYADLDGSLEEATKKIRRESDVLSTQTVEAAGAGESKLTVRINREDIMLLLDAVDEYRKAHNDAMLITGVTIADYGFNEDVEEEEGEQEFVTAVDDEGNEVQVPAAPTNTAKAENGETVIPGFTDVDIDYTAYYMQEPTEPEVGPAYDKTIWDTDNWRDPVTEN